MLIQKFKVLRNVCIKYLMIPFVLYLKLMEKFEKTNMSSSFEFYGMI